MTLCLEYSLTDNLITVLTENTVVSVLCAGCVLVLYFCVCMICCRKDLIDKNLFAYGAGLLIVTVLGTCCRLFVYNDLVSRSLQNVIYDNLIANGTFFYIVTVLCTGCRLFINNRLMSWRLDYGFTDYFVTVITVTVPQTLHFLPSVSPGSVQVASLC